MWEVVDAAGVLDPRGDMVVRLIAVLMAVLDRERMVARKRALEAIAAARTDGRT